MVPKIQQIPGHIPPFWDGSAVFFANILSLFYGNIAETDVLKREVGALETYGSRLLPLINIMFQGDDNLLFLESEPDVRLIEYFSRDLGLTLPRLEVIPADIYSVFTPNSDQYPSKGDIILDAIAHCKAEWIDGYVVDDALLNIARLTGKQILGTPQGSRNGNDKWLLHQYLHSTSLDVFDSFFAETPDQIESGLKQLSKMGYTYAVIKSPIGASGVGMQKIMLSQSSYLDDVPDYLLHEGRILVQGWLDETVQGVEFVGSPSIQLFLDHDSIYLYDLTDQILSPDSIHEGNIAPPLYLIDEGACRDELFKQAGIAGEWLFQQGYRGTGSIDFHVIRRDYKLEVRICEINARVTGATYPAILARKFNPQGAWLMRNIRFDPKHDTSNLLDAIDQTGLLYRPDQEVGILPFNFNPTPSGKIVKGQFLFLGSSVNDVFSLLKKVQELDTIKGEYDRD